MYMSSVDMITDAIIEGIKGVTPNVTIPLIKIVAPHVLPIFVIYFVGKKILWKIKTNRFM